MPKNFDTRVWRVKARHIRQTPRARVIRLRIYQFKVAAIMSILRRPVYRNYAIAQVCTFAGVWLTEVTGSMLPIALATSALLLTVVPMLRAIWSE